LNPAQPVSGLGPLKPTARRPTNPPPATASSHPSHHHHRLLPSSSQAEPKAEGETNREGEAKPPREERERRRGGMGRKRKELLSSAPWRTGEAAEDEEAARLSREGKVSVTNNPGETATMNVPRSRRQDLDLTVDDFDEEEIDPELRYSFQRNSRVYLLPSPPLLSPPAHRFQSSSSFSFPIPPIPPPYLYATMCALGIRWIVSLL